MVTFKGTLHVPGDKSISHRALIFSSLAQGTCKISRLSPARDCMSTMACLEKLGLVIDCCVTDADNELTHQINSPGIKGLAAPDRTLDAGNSGTTMRLLAGLVSGKPWDTTLDGDSSLRKRPMARVLDKLYEMGAQIDYGERTNYAPFTLHGGRLKGRNFDLPIASAQLQTALLLAGLQAEGRTSVTLPAPVRDHTERMFAHLGVPFWKSPDGLTTAVDKLKTPVAPFELNIPGDISSAAFFMVAAACTKGSHIILPGVGLNTGRTLLVQALKSMGSNISVSNQVIQNGEPTGTIEVRGENRLKGIFLRGEKIASGIDEIPLLALAGSLADGVFSVRDADELRVKESDRLTLICENLRRAGAEVHETANGFDITGSEELKGGCTWITDGDHRMAMIGLIASLICKDPIIVDNTDCISVSYPDFRDDLDSIIS